MQSRTADADEAAATVVATGSEAGVLEWQCGMGLQIFPDFDLHRAATAGAGGMVGTGGSQGQGGTGAAGGWADGEPCGLAAEGGPSQIGGEIDVAGAADGESEGEAGGRGKQAGSDDRRGLRQIPGGIVLVGVGPGFRESVEVVVFVDFVDGRGLADNDSNEKWGQPPQ